MPQQRFIKVRGKPGLLAANPFALGHNPQRFAGKMRDPALDGEAEFSARYRDVDEVLPKHPDLMRSVAEGALELVAECVANTHAEATEKMTPAAKPARARSAE